MYQKIVSNLVWKERPANSCSQADDASVLAITHCSIARKNAVDGQWQVPATIDC